MSGAAARTGGFKEKINKKYVYEKGTVVYYKMGYNEQPILTLYKEYFRNI